MDEFRFRSQQSPQNEPPMNTLVSPPRNGTQPRLPPSVQDARSSLPRRFTTDSALVPTLSHLTSSSSASASTSASISAAAAAATSTSSSSQKRQSMPPQAQDNPGQAQALQKVQLLEKKRLEYERIREQKRRFELEMQKLDQQEKMEEQELAQMAEDLGRMAGHQSEPTTPPEYRDPQPSTGGGFPTFLSRPNRYSTSSLTSPPGMYNRPGRSGSQIASPQAGMLPGRFAFDDQNPARSFPATRRNSDDDEKEEAVRQDPTSHRSTNATNRYSMPVTKSRSGFYDMNLDQTNTTRFLFGDDENSSGDSKTYGLPNSDDTFPTLTRREDQPNMLSASSAALDLAYAQLSAGEDATSTSSGWGTRNRNQQGRPSSFRHSLDLKGVSENTTAIDPNNQVAAPPNTNVIAAPKLSTSYSTNDIPTAKPPGPSSIANNHAQQHFNNHNASMGRIPAGAMPNRQSRDLSLDQGNAPSNSSNYFGPGPGPHPPQGPHPGQGPNGSQPVPGAPFNGYYSNGYNPNGGNNFNVPPLVGSMQNLALGNQSSMYPGPQPYSNFQPAYGQQPPMRDNQTRIIQERRRQDQESLAQYSNMTMEQAIGQIYGMCRDQHGCRYLQKQLETRNPEYISQIFQETVPHIVELMTDPFGNYLCQKLFEYCNEKERDSLAEGASCELVRIALNQHGTRALQKMIEYLENDVQTQLVIDALGMNVVELIQDLNGNHVIQKCLNKLSSQDASFIFTAVGNNCVDVGTHRHGCCVLQRCIDHAAGAQKTWLIAQITRNAPILVQDPFGNYVVQYIIDLNETSFTEPLVVQFSGKIGQLSRHKFSSNVIEKCLRCASDVSKDIIVSELLTPGEMDKLLRDSFANYVIQTALEYSTPDMKQRLIEVIKPILPTVRNTPYGRRIAAKITASDPGSTAPSSGQATPVDPSQGQIPLRQINSRPMQNQTSPASNTPGASYINQGPLGAGGPMNGGMSRGGGAPGPPLYLPTSSGMGTPGQQQSYGMNSAPYAPLHHPGGPPGQAGQHDLYAAPPRAGPGPIQPQQPFSGGPPPRHFEATPINQTQGGPPGAVGSGINGNGVGAPGTIGIPNHSPAPGIQHQNPQPLLEGQGFGEPPQNWL